MTAFTVAVFAAVYLGMAFGRWPGLALDRTGIALLGAIVLVVAGALAPAVVRQAIDVPTLIILFGLMILSAQFAAAGFYDWCVHRLAVSALSPARTLALVTAVGGALSAILVNDIVVFAMAPLLAVGLTRRGLDPRPYLMALAGAANVGSAVTIIGNPQNILIGQVGALDFWRFVALCGPPSLIALAIVHASVSVVWRDALACRGPVSVATAPSFDRIGIAKAIVGASALLALFATPIPREIGVLIIAGLLLLSRRIETRRVLGAVDWQLLVLFAGLFVVTGALTETGLPRALLERLAAQGVSLESLTILAPVALIASNTIGNVPAVVLLLAVAPDLSSGGLHALALLSTFAGNLLIVGSVCNIIVAERAAAAGTRLTFADFARAGIPMTLVSFAVALAWLLALDIARF